jgi:hypothetical protein
MAYRKICMAEAPVNWIVSIDSLFTRSIVSTKDLPSIPVEWNTRASIPGKAPKPTAATNRRPIIKSGTARRRQRMLLLTI